MATFAALNRTLEQVEINTLDELGHWPVVSSAGAVLRGALACAQTIGGIAMLTFALFAAIFDRDTAHMYAELGQFYLLHGFANLVRACVEFIPFVNLIAELHDQAGQRAHGNPYPREGRFSYLNNVGINALLQPQEA